MRRDSGHLLGSWNGLRASADRPLPLTVHFCTNLVRTLSMAADARGTNRGGPTLERRPAVESRSEETARDCSARPSTTASPAGSVQPAPVRATPTVRFNPSSPRPQRAPGPHRVAPIDPLEQIAELGGADRHRSAHRRRPRKSAPLQALGIQRDTHTVVPKDLQKPHLGVRGRRKDRPRGGRVRAGPRGLDRDRDLLSGIF